MLTEAIILTIVSLVLLASGIRGCTTARGTFCRRCRFDLAGLTTPQTCPECGRSLALPRATRPSIRRAHRPTLVIAAIAFATAIGIAALSVPRGPAFFANLPDGQILLLNRIGVDGALTELAARSNRTPPMSDAHWRTAIARGLAHQDDTATPWDPRWGKVLGEAFVQDRMTNGQVRSYLEHAYETSVRIRDRISSDARGIPYRIGWTHGRISVIGLSIPTDLNISHTITGTGFVGDTQPDSYGSSNSDNFIIPAHPPGESMSMYGDILLPRSAVRSGSLRAYTETRFTVRNIRGDVVFQQEPHRVEQTVRAVAPNEQIVRIVTDAASVESILGGASISPFTIFVPRREQIASQSIDSGRVRIKHGVLPLAIAGRLYAVFDSGECMIGMMTIPAESGLHGYASFTIRTSPSNFDDRLPLLNALAERPTVDLVFRTDPTVANDNPLIDEVVEITMLFPDVPVVVVQDPNDLYAYPLDRTKHTPAAPSGDTQQRPTPMP